MLDENGRAYRYRDTSTSPLTAAEVKAVLGKLGVPARELLRKNDAAYKELGLAGDEPDAVLVPLFAAHPTLMQRPIGIKGARAVVGRPPERLLELG